MNKPSAVVFRKELADARRNRQVALMVLGLSAIAILSVVVAAAGFRAKSLAFQRYLDALHQSGVAQDPPPTLFPLQLLRGALEYLEVVGAIIAIIIGYGLTAKEKQRGTLPLLLSRPVRASAIVWGKVRALSVIWMVTIATLALALVGAIRAIGGRTLSGPEYGRLLITMIFAWLYLTMWSVISLAIASRTRNLSTALITGLTLWLTLVLILPQIGDTMDPDNQVPGGLFKSLQIAKPQEKAVLARFSGFENARNFLEGMSITKRFERSAFAYTGIKEIYNGAPLGAITADMRTNLLWLLGGTGLSVVAALTQGSKQNLLRKA